MTKAAFEKIEAGVNEASAYLDGSADKSAYRIRVSAGVRPVENEPEAVTRALGKSG